MRLSRFQIPAFVLMAAVVSTPTLLLADEKSDSPAGQRVFTAGHSFHMPIVVPLNEIAKSAGISGHTVVGAQSIGGSTVTQHWDKADDQNKAKQTINKGTVDVLTLSPNLKTPDLAIDKFVALALEKNPKARVTVQASWYPYEFPAGSELRTKFKTNADRDNSKIADLRKAWAVWTDPLRDHVKSVNAAHADSAKRQVLFIVPAGEAVLQLRERVAKGEVPGIQKQSDLFTDPIGHGRAPLAVLTAYCHYAVIYGKSPVGLPVPSALKSAMLGDDTEKVNRILQECAWEAVLAEPLSGMKAKK